MIVDDSVEDALQNGQFLAHFAAVCVGASTMITFTCYSHMCSNRCRAASACRRATWHSRLLFSTVRRGWRERKRWPRAPTVTVYSPLSPPTSTSSPSSSSPPSPLNLKPLTRNNPGGRPHASTGRHESIIVWPLAVLLRAVDGRRHLRPLISQGRTVRLITTAKRRLPAMLRVGLHTRLAYDSVEPNAIHLS